MSDQSKAATEIVHLPNSLRADAVVMADADTLREALVLACWSGSAYSAADIAYELALRGEPRKGEK